MKIQQGPAERRIPIALTVCLIALAFCIDLLTPSGYGLWMLYLLAVISSMRWAKPLQVGAVATGCMALMAVALYVSNPGLLSAADSMRVVIPRFLGVCFTGIIAVPCALQVRSVATLRLSLEEEIRARNRFHAIVESAGNGVLITDGAGVIQMSNEALEVQFGYEPGELIGKSVDLLVPTDLRANHAKLMRDYLASPDPPRLGVGRKFKGLRKDGTEFPAEITVSPMQFQYELLIIASVRDLTEKEEFESIIIRQNRRLGALRQIDIAIAGTHDIKHTANTVLNHVRSELQVDAAALLHHNRHDLTLDYVAGVGFQTTALQHTRLRMGEGYAGAAAETLKKLFIPDLLRATGTLFTRSHHVSSEGFTSYMAVPLVAKGRIEGVLELFNRTVLRLSDEQEEFLDALAGQTAIAIDNADLYSDLETANSELRKSYDLTLEGWVRALDMRDKETEGHSRRVTEVTVKLARAAGIAGEALTHVRRGALLHDIGKLGIPDAILSKPGKLDREELEVMRKHPVYAYEWLSPIDFLRGAIDIPYCHHERWDGTGYPRGIRGEVIPLAARLFAPVDIWDALSSDRPYRKAWPRDQVLEHITSLAGSHLDPAAVEAFLKLDRGDAHR